MRLGEGDLGGRAARALRRVGAHGVMEGREPARRVVEVLDRHVQRRALVLGELALEAAEGARRGAGGRRVGGDRGASIVPSM